MGRKRQTFSKSLKVRVMLEVLQEICVCRGITPPQILRSKIESGRTARSAWK